MRYTGGFTNCTTLGVEEPVRSGTALQAVWDGGNTFALLGLPDGRHLVQLYDAQGRLVLESKVHSADGRSEGMALQGQGAALYLVVVDHCQAVKLGAMR